MAPEHQRSDTPDLCSLHDLLVDDPTSASLFPDLGNGPSPILDANQGLSQIHHRLDDWTPGLDVFNFEDPPAIAISSAISDGTGGNGGDVDQNHTTESPSFSAGESFAKPPIGDARTKIPPKVGTRFSKDSLRILRGWLSAHGRHPFPTDEERRVLQYQTGLTKTQILNWLANARRRGKIPEYQSSSPRLRSNATSPVGIPRRSGTPTPWMGTPPLDPLQRWVDSPPEHEPATAAAIARAVASSPPIIRDQAQDYSIGDSESGSSIYRPSPASSIRTSNSSGGSAYSFDSKDSTGTTHLGSTQRHLRRKRRGAGRKRNAEKTPLSAPSSTFQCTFCTDTFSTKHTWQRHEKSLHLALDRWVCAPDGPTYITSEGETCCIFCGQANPDDIHIEGHNFSICQQRDLNDRTFHRKDHLGQHLRLVHHCKHADLERPLKEWKMDTPPIRSVCGFCGMTLDTWQARTDHLADHFKLGSTMADWQGDWGLVPSVLARLENAIAPYMIDLERNAPFPFSATNNMIESPRHAFELIKLELSDYLEMHHDRYRRFPDASELQFEACRIVFTAEISSYEVGRTSSSWVRDLIMSVKDTVERAKLSPLRANSENRVTTLKIIGKSDLFETCPFEDKLLSFVQQNSTRILTDAELQQQVCQVIQDAENESSSPSELVTTWFLQLARSSTAWLDEFRLRAQIPRIGHVLPTSDQANDYLTIDNLIQNYNILDKSLHEYVKTLQAKGLQPDDNDIRQKGLSIINELGNQEWRQVAAQNHSWLVRFKRRHLPWSNTPKNTVRAGQEPDRVSSREQHQALDGAHKQKLHSWPKLASYDDPAGVTGTALDFQAPPPKAIIFFNDPNFDRWVGRQLARWVAATMSPHNPNQHIPTDEELQHQARWIAYEDGDPWNFTPADHPEWLRRFKREVGLLNDLGPGLFGSHLGYHPAEGLPGDSNEWGFPRHREGP